MKIKILEVLDSLNIEYKNYEHSPTFTCDDAKWINIPWKRVKSLLLRNKKATQYYMVVLEDSKKLNSNELRKILWENKLSFASEERMFNTIWVKPWHVSPFAIINNLEKDVKIIFDSTLKNTQLWFHPGQNDNTTVLNNSWVEKFLIYLWIEFSYLEL